MTILPEFPAKQPRGPRQSRQLPNRTQTYVAVGLVVVLGAVVGFVVLRHGGGKSPSDNISVPPRPSSAAARYVSEAETAALQAGSVQASLTYAVGNSSTNLGLSIGPAGATEQFSAPDGADADISLVGGVAYVQANSAYLISVAHLSAAVAAADSTGQWLEVTSDSPLYPTVTADMTLPEIFKEFAPLPPVTDGGGPIDGDIDVGGALPTGSNVPSAFDLPANLHMTAAAPHLPTEMDTPYLYNGSWADASVMFSGWGQPVQVTAPAGAVPLP